MKKYRNLFLSVMLGSMMWVSSFAQQIEFKVNPQTGAIGQLNIGNDAQRMNWLVATDGSQYPWVKEQYGWGLGYFTETQGGTPTKRTWSIPSAIKKGGMDVTYQAGDVEIRVKRRLEKDDLIEEYTFRNKGKEELSLSDIGIYTPFNDNYPDARECIDSRTDVHIWEGGNAAYVNAMRMGGYAPHLGLILTDGAVVSYEISERGIEKANSQTRGVISLNLPDLKLKPGEKYTLAWQIFSHSGKEDFRNKLLEKGSVLVECNKYVFEGGEMARVKLISKQPLDSCTILMNGMPLSVQKQGDTWTAETRMERWGEARFDVEYGKGKETHASCLVISSESALLGKRVNFIRAYQQMNDPSDPRDGAFLIYDNELDTLYLNDTPNVNPPDRDEGGERVGMGVLLAKMYRLTQDPSLMPPLLKYAKFLREKLQTKDYVTYSTTDHKGRNRGYNYMWVAAFYFHMYQITKDKQYAMDGYLTLQAMFRQFGYGFYAIEIPVRLGLQSLQEAGLTEQYEDLKNDFIKTGDTFVDNGLDYPKHEVNFEQSIVAPSIMFLTQLYLETGIQKYLDEATRQMPVLEAFCGSQPSYHLNDIAIRHWDGYWFGKREMWGDVFPHYWSTLTGAAYYYYALCTGDSSYQKRAENIVRNNLCLFAENGKASCAYLYPYKVNGVRAQFYDPYANDQDWALVFYLLVNENI